MSHIHNDNDNDNDKITFKFRWLTPLLAICTFIGIVYSLYQKPYKWDEAVVGVETLTKKSAEHDVTLAVITAELKDMASDIKEIKRAVK